MGNPFNAQSLSLKRDTDDVKRVIAPKEDTHLRLTLGVGFFALCKGFINAQSVMPGKNYASMPKT